MNAFDHRTPRAAGAPHPPHNPFDDMEAVPRGRKARGSFAAVVSVGLHLLALLAVVSVQPHPPEAPEAEPIIVQLVHLPPPAPPAKPDKPPKPAPANPPPKRHIFRPTKTTPPPEIVPLPAGKGPSADGDDELSDAQVGSAATAGSGPPGRATPRNSIGCSNTSSSTAGVPA